jgi:subtilisin family serine protease
VYDAREDSEKTPRLSAPRPPATAAAATLRPRASCAALAQGALTAAPWNLDRVSAPAGAAGTRRSRLDGAFAAPECLCGRGVDVFVVDTGARTSHSEFRGRVGGGANFVDPAPSACDGSGTSAEVSGDVHDDSGHGTHVAGTALGSTSGVAKCATLRPVRILDGDGKGKSSSILEALDWIAARVSENGGRRSVVSMSLGGPRSGAVDDAVAEMAERHGVPVIVAAGNEARDASDTSPAGAGAAVAVGSTSCYPDAETKTKTKTKTNAEDARAERGASSERCVTDVVSPFSNHGDVVRVYAPGHGVRSAWNAGDDAFEKSSGTSMAAPLVAGAAALYLEKYPTAKPSDVARALTTTATAVTWDDGREEIGGGGGMLDLEAMLRVAPG